MKTLIAAIVLAATTAAASAEDNNDRAKRDPVWGAQKFCFAMDRLGLFSEPCRIEGFLNPTIVLSADTNAAEARKMCAVMPQVAADLEANLSGYTLEFFSPYSTRPLATCSLG